MDVDEEQYTLDGLEEALPDDAGEEANFDSVDDESDADDATTEDDETTSADETDSDDDDEIMGAGDVM